MEKNKLTRDDSYVFAAAAIFAAIKLIASHGWVRGELCTEKGYCITGALLASSKDIDIQEVAFDFIRAECQATIVSQWNDLCAVNKREVVAMLERAARRARAALTPVERRAGAQRGSIYSRECSYG